ncbi:MAG: hypothetical protein ACI8UO_002696 [Verrucomicrobiales bacterium]|jgi:hypothetical protein
MSDTPSFKTGPISRELLTVYLTRASALEQQLLSAYLYTAYSLKQDMSEGGIANHVEMGSTLAWRGMITGVAVQEMLHLALASNMLNAVGGTPLFRPFIDLPIDVGDQPKDKWLDLNFPIGPKQMKEAWGFPNGAWLGLWPFSEQTIRTFIWFESFEESPHFPGPLWIDPEVNLATVEPMRGLQMSSLVELYMTIAECFLKLGSENSGELFVGDPGLQVTNAEVTALFDFPSVLVYGKNGFEQVPALQAVTDVPSALTAINTIIVQGEGDTDEWQAFIAQKRKEYPGLVPDQFPFIQSPSHHVVFQQVLNGTPASKSKPATPGYLQIKAVNPDFNPVRPVAQNVLPDDPCKGNPACEEHVNLITEPFTRDLAEFTDRFFVSAMDSLNIGFTINTHVAGNAEVQTYAKACMMQTAIRPMSYLLGPVANSLTQIKGGESFNAGAGFIYPPDHSPPSPMELAEEFRKLAKWACQLSQRAAADKEVWLTPSYLAIPEKGAAYGKASIESILADILAPDLEFMADRLDRAIGQAPPIDPNTGEKYPQHVCLGLNACAGQDIAGTAAGPGEGVCATAEPHVCSGQNHCAGQGGCGFTPSPDTTPDLQNHPGENQSAGLTFQRGFWLPNPAGADSACGSPILPSLVNTYGLNTPPASDRGGLAEVYDECNGFVWDFARLKLKEKLGEIGETDYADYRKSCSDSE